MSLEILKKSVYEAPVVKKGDYEYVIHPLTDGIPSVTPRLLQEVTRELKKRIMACGRIDRIVTMEAMGIPLATALSLELNIPFTIIRKREYRLPGEVSVDQVTGYSTSKLFINGLQKGDIIVLVDDVLSTGGTLRAVLSVLQKQDIHVKGVFIVIDKGSQSKQISKDFGIDVTSLLTITIKQGKPVISV